MPHLDARALDQDPQGMAVLRAAIAPEAVTAAPVAMATTLPFLPAAGLSPARLRDRMIGAMLRLPPARTAAAV
ncbi:hypothetical protein [uncultured Alsobacter sp.]|uniref:hypothetical protein n=1 Tax=uncultured Alsobacter sp. TaxID=1748258 RepID=UPI0025CED3E4|nr:hypothetical protein [uncultured Alsobacter sp.]